MEILTKALTNNSGSKNFQSTEKYIDKLTQTQKPPKISLGCYLKIHSRLSIGLTKEKRFKEIANNGYASGKQSSAIAWALLELLGDVSYTENYRPLVELINNWKLNYI